MAAFLPFLGPWSHHVLLELAFWDGTSSTVRVVEEVENSRLLTILLDDGIDVPHHVEFMSISIAWTNSELYMHVRQHG